MTSTPVVLPVLSGQQAQAWDTLMSVAGSLGEGWTLIGANRRHQASPRPGGGCSVWGALGSAAFVSSEAHHQAMPCTSRQSRQQHDQAPAPLNGSYLASTASRSRGNSSSGVIPVISR